MRKESADRIHYRCYRLRGLRHTGQHFRVKLSIAKITRHATAIGTALLYFAISFVSIV